MGLKKPNGEIRNGSKRLNAGWIFSQSHAIRFVNGVLCPLQPEDLQGQIREIPVIPGFENFMIPLIRQILQD